MDRQTFSILAGTVVIIGLIIFGLCYRTTEYIEVQDRYWTYYSAIKYDTTTLVPVSHTTCSGSPSRCTSTVTLETRTVSHLRCDNNNFGRELPPVSPVLYCSERSNDYRVEYVNYRATFNVIGKKGPPKTSNFQPNMWDQLIPGQRRMVIRDIFGNILQFAEA